MKEHKVIIGKTRMHSSRMRSACSSSHLLGWCLPQCMGWYLPQCMLGYTPPRAWAWTPPGSGPRPPTSSLGLGLDNAGPPPPRQGGHGTGKTGNLVLTFSRQGKHREFCCDTGKNLDTQGKYFSVTQGKI